MSTYPKAAQCIYRKHIPGGQQEKRGPALPSDARPPRQTKAPVVVTGAFLLQNCRLCAAFVQPIFEFIQRIETDDIAAVGVTCVRVHVPRLASGDLILQGIVRMDVLGGGCGPGHSCLAEPRADSFLSIGHRILTSC